MTLVTALPGASTAPRRPGAAERSPFRVRHELAGSPLLGLDRLADLAGRLPGASVEHNVGSVPTVLPGGDAPRLDLPAVEIVRSIESNGCWMVLKNVEQDPEYAALLDACVAALEPLVSADEGPSVVREGFVFLSAPGSVTPAHLDHEHNVLLQVRGKKTMSIGRFEDDTAMLAQVEALHSGSHRNLPTLPVDLEEFSLESGDGVYVPVHAPHVVTNGAELSVSLSVTWRTAYGIRTGRVHGLNALLRRAGLPVRSPGDSSTRDAVKAFAWRALLAARRRVDRAGS